MEAIKRLVFVCTGNTCRSPMAAAVARAEAKKRSLSIEIESCGTVARAGDRATDHAVKACSEAGLDITHHSAKNISDLPDDEDTIYAVMSRQHEAWLRYVLGIPGERIVILGNGVPDPYGGSLKVYKETFNYLVSAIKALFDRIEDNIAVIGADGSQTSEAEFDFDIYWAEGEHAPAISMLENHTFTDAWSLALLADEIENEDAIFLIASDKYADPAAANKKSQRVYGYAIAIITADIAQLLKLCVDEHVRRHGVAEALLNSIIREAKKRGCTEITLEARVSNAPAIALYEKAGFQSLGVRPGFYSDPKEDALIMTAPLVSPDGVAQAAQQDAGDDDIQPDVPDTEADGAEADIPDDYTAGAEDVTPEDEAENAEDGTPDDETAGAADEIPADDTISEGDGMPDSEAAGTEDNIPGEDDEDRLPMIFPDSEGYDRQEDVPGSQTPETPDEIPDETANGAADDLPEDGADGTDDVLPDEDEDEDRLPMIFPDDDYE